MSTMTLEIHPPTIRELPSLVSTPSTDERPSFPSLGLDISRPPSTSSQASSLHLQRRPSPVPGLQLPGLSQLSALASVATSTRTSPDSAGPLSNSHVFFRHTLTPPAMSSATPSATVGPGGQPPLCQNCGTFTTPLWRRDENGSVLCNACGLFLKLHGRPRPISLKTDVIKSRNRVRSSNGVGFRKKLSAQDGLSATIQHSEATEQQAVEAVKRAAESQQTAVAALRRSRSPISRIGTPSNHHSVNIAPQSMFDSVALDSQPPFYTPSLQDSAFRSDSPALRTDNVGQVEGQPPYALLLQQATKLQIRVSELEVINSLFRGRVAELEATQEEAKNKEQAAREAEEAARQEAVSAQTREKDLKRRIDELESELAELNDRPRTKKMRLSDSSEDHSHFVNSSPDQSS